MIAAGKSDLSMVCSITGGVLNMVLDYVLIAVLDMGIAGAAIATGLGYSVTAVVGIGCCFPEKQPASFCKAGRPEENFVGNCHKWQFGNGDRLSDRYRYYDV